MNTQPTYHITLQRPVKRSKPTNAQRKRYAKHTNPHWIMSSRKTIIDLFEGRSVDNLTVDYTELYTMIYSNPLARTFDRYNRKTRIVNTLHTIKRNVRGIVLSSLILSLPVLLMIVVWLSQFGGK